MEVLRQLAAAISGTLAVAAITTASAGAATGKPTVPPQRVAPGQQTLTTTTEGGATVLPTTRTIPHWWGSTLDPNDGITYGYNMVGADPHSCSGIACDVTVQVDITPIVLHLDGMTFSGTDVLPAVLASPVFSLNDYGSTPYASQGDYFTGGVRGPGGPFRRATQATCCSWRTRRCVPSSTTSGAARTTCGFSRTFSPL